ncbi:uncharacterized protein LOC128263826 isoform X6 [Drosophila gunungcola]|uniref:uncharacterized protein LOC128263826 isoform X6 n=1 Tax=Drosophila gunungcola TaxID=103775 RepID=UPI0022E16512|nr:uncharacterized protein LOC128263826 isoform X6 [Drosophila gunungcola]
MEHLDLAGYLGSKTQSWNCLGAFDQQDAVYLSSSRQILEPIMEETSEDEEHGQCTWSGCPEQRSSFWSSIKSESGTMVRMVIKDVDSMSERDFACPPKRPRRSLDTDPCQGFEDNVLMRRPQRQHSEYHNSLERFLVSDTCARDSCGSQGQRSNSGNRRGGSFEDYNSDNDSYHSLSRSSSLVQFESLERQLTLQEQHQSMSSLGNSSPSLFTSELGASTRPSDSNPESRRESSSFLSLIKRYESSDGRLHQTYYELNKLKFEDQQRLFSKCAHQTELKSDSETGSSSSSSSDSCSQRSYLGSGIARRTKIQPITATRRVPPNSAENRSEFSGYCELRTLQLEKSKCTPMNFKILSGEEEELLLLEDGSPHCRNSPDLCLPKIEQTTDTAASPFSPCSPSLSINSSPERAGSRTEMSSPLPSPTGSTTSTSSLASFTWLRNSLPDIREPRGPLSFGIGNLDSPYSSVLGPSSHICRSQSSSSNDSSLPTTTSFPNELQQLGLRRRMSHNHHTNSSVSNSCSEAFVFARDQSRDDFFLECQSIPRSCSVSESARRTLCVASAGYLNASYQNLTLLDYTDASPPKAHLERNHKRSKSEDMSGGIYQQIICKNNFLLDEISKIYDKNISILTDKPIQEETLPPPGGCISNAPEEPQMQHVQLFIKQPPRHKGSASSPKQSFGKTFDQDPTNLSTNYAQSLEHCQFVLQDIAVPCHQQVISQRPLPKRQFQSLKQRSLVSSTPNLSACDNDRQEPEDEIYVNSAHTSMHHLPKPLGILLHAGSRHSFGKEVSFCPVVSKYCWQLNDDQCRSSEQGPSSDEDLKDATVVHNTKENENIASLYEQNQALHLRESSIEENETTEYKVNIATPDCFGQRTEAETTLESELATSSAVSLEPRVVANLFNAAQEGNARPLSLTLPILSEPPTNRALHILYASQQLLELNESPQICEMLPTTTVGRADEKQPGSKGLLSRITNGLRFSLRRKKKLQNLEHHEEKGAPNQILVFKAPIRNSTGSAKSGDCLHIPLKQPRSPQLEDSKACTASVNSSRQLGHLGKTPTLQKVVICKPPLPKLPTCSGNQSPSPLGVSASGTTAANATELLLSAEQEQYKLFGNQLTADFNAANMRGTELPSRARVALTTNMITARSTVVTAVPVSVSSVREGGKMGLIETNLDTHETVISGNTRSLMDIKFNPLSFSNKAYIVKRLNGTRANYDMDNIDGEAVISSSGEGCVPIASVRRPHKSMEFLMDKENQKFVLAPENELQKSHDQNPGALSEHQLRVLASLQRLNIPDWFRQYNKGSGQAPDGTNAATGESPGAYRPGNFSRKRTQDSGRWQGLNAKTTSLNSLGSQRFDRCPLLMSPSAHSHHGGQSTYTCSSTTGHGQAPGQTGVCALRWSTSHLNSTQTSPSVSQRESFARGAPINSSFMSVSSSSGVLRKSYRQPYLGWRSTEKLSQRTPHERKCWLESSFVGTRPLDSPQTPVIDNSPSKLEREQQQQLNQLSPHQLHLNVSLSPIVAAVQPSLRINGLSRIGGGGAPERSLSSASLEDVLASLLGLPTVLSSQNSNHNSNNRPNANPPTTESDTANRQQLEVLSAVEQLRLRRHSEGDAPKQKNQPRKGQPESHSQSDSKSFVAGISGQQNICRESRWISLHDTASTNTNPVLLRGGQLNGEPKAGLGQQIRCRNTKCEHSSSPNDAKKLFKSCHNCSHLYCSRECRRAHWEKHRKACLHSRASNLCRQVLATCKDDLDSQRHLSMLARKGSLSQGRGVVRVLFRSAEAAEGFIKKGFQCMGEANYVRWPDLMPAEMGLELYSELLKLSTEYKPETKMLIYVAICVVSEAPGMGQAPVRWERQLVSRCAKLKLCKTMLVELEEKQTELQHPPSGVDVPERTEILILTFNFDQRSLHYNRELILSNILDILSRRGVALRKHYPEIFQRLQAYSEGQSDKFNPVTLHPRDTQTGQGFVCIIMPVHSEGDFIKLPSAADGVNRVTAIDVGSPVALAHLDEDELLQCTSKES